MINRILRIAAFQNHEFYKAQAMRLSTFGKPRMISCGEDFARHIAVPRGCIGEVLERLKSHGIQPEVHDERNPGVAVAIEFRGRLRPDQEGAAAQMLRHDARPLRRERIGFRCHGLRRFCTQKWMYRHMQQQQKR